MPGATGYNVVCTDKGGWWWWPCGVVTSGATTTHTVDRKKYGNTDTDLAWYRPHIVAVQAVKNSVLSGWTDSDKALPAFAPDSAYISAVRGNGSITLSWTPPIFAQGYEIDCATRENNVTGAYTLCADVETATVTNGKISATIDSWTASGTNYSIDNTKTYDISIILIVPKLLPSKRRISRRGRPEKNS